MEYGVIRCIALALSLAHLLFLSLWVENSHSVSLWCCYNASEAEGLARVLPAPAAHDPAQRELPHVQRHALLQPMAFISLLRHTLMISDAVGSLRRLSLRRPPTLCSPLARLIGAK